MWIQLGNEYLNLDQVLRVRFNRGWKGGTEELVAEVEGFIKGEVQVFCRYRGSQAERLQEYFAGKVPANKTPDVFATQEAASRSLANTVHDMKLP